MISYIIIAFVISLQCGDILTIKKGIGLDVFHARFIFAIYIDRPSHDINPFQCVGVALSPIYILTTLKCTIINEQNATLSIRYGKNTRDKGESVKVVKILINEINDDRDASIAMLELDRFVIFDKGPTSITLPNDDFRVQNSDDVTIMGYGTVGKTKRIRLAYVTCKIYKTSDNGNYIFAFNIPQGEDYSISNADVGSAAFVDNIFIGIIAKLNPTSQYVYITNILKHKGFLENITRIDMDIDPMRKP